MQAKQNVENDDENKLKMLFISNNNLEDIKHVWPGGGSRHRSSPDNMSLGRSGFIL